MPGAPAEVTCSLLPVPPAHSTPVRVDVVGSLGTAQGAEVQSLLDEAQEADGFPGLSDQAHLCIEKDAPLGAISLLARTEGSERLAGYASLVERDSSWRIETVVDPDRRDPALGIHSALLDAALAEVATRGGGRVRAWLRAGLEQDRDTMSARGLEPTRELLQLRAPLPPEAVHDASSPPVQVRPFRPGRDEDAWLEVNARAFAGHPEQATWTREDLERREREPWFDPGGFLLHEADGRIAGFCWTKVHLHPVLGEIYVIGVDPDFQGRGLGRALTRAGLGHLATRAVPTAMLYVEGDNTPAIVLYRSLAFTEHHREVQFTGEVTAE